MKCNKFFGLWALVLLPTAVPAQTSAGDSVMQHVRGNRLSIGGYGEVAYSRQFYSDHVNRYSSPANYKDDPSHGRFDIPHAVIYLGYDFGRGWTLGTEIEFEHTGTGSAIENEADEAAEWEREQEKGGEVELEQFWINKRFSRAANLKLGHIIVPVGLNNAHHEPLNYFTVYRPEGEDMILPSTWHDTGISFWGRSGKFSYEVELLAGLNAMLFNRDRWIHHGAGSPFEFKPANQYGFAARVDYRLMPGLRIGVSGYYGNSAHNTYPNDLKGDGKPYDNVKGTVAIGAFDLTLNRWNWIVRGQADYGYVGDTEKLNIIKDAKAHASNSPVKSAMIGKNAVCMGIEAGYDIFSQIAQMRNSERKLYVFGRYEYYDSYIPEKNKEMFDYTNVNRIAFGVNYHPVPQVVIKADYSRRLLKNPYNDEPSLNVGIAYEGFFL
ncbi:MAG: hypothetical protein IJT75_00620 [Bacteroidaceae bacterium]|nr:hypothetical protein [Bacteroidaceae bacterium]